MSMANELLDAVAVVDFGELRGERHALLLVAVLCRLCDGEVVGNNLLSWTTIFERRYYLLTPRSSSTDSVVTSAG